MRTTRWKPTVAIAIAVACIVLGIAGCDANPSHVYINVGLPGPTSVQNDTAYAATIDSAEVTRTNAPGAPACVAYPDEQPTPLTFSPSIIPPGGSVPVPYFSSGAGAVTLQVHFTLTGSKGADGLPVTGIAQFTWVSCPIH